MKKVTWVNLFLLLFFLFLADYLMFLYYCPSEFRKKYNITYQYFYKNKPLSRSRCLNLEDYDFRKVEQKNNNKKSVVLFGCSFTYGDGLSEEETFSHQLFENTNGYDIYNFGISGGGVQHMLYLLKDLNILNTLKNPPEYIIYTYIPNQIERIRYYYFWVSTANFISITSKFDKHNNIVLEKDVFFPKPLYRTFIMKLFYNVKSKYEKTDEKKYFNDNKEMFYQMLLQSKQIINNKYPQTKFVLLIYDDEPANDCNYGMNSYFEKLSQKGFIIIKVDDLIGMECKNKERQEDQFHPTVQAWKLTVPKLIQKLNLQKN